MSSKLQAASLLVRMVAKLVNPALIQLTKSCLQKTFHGVALSESQLRTALAEITATLNAWPLTYVSEDSADRPLTPNDLLNMKFNIEEDISDSLVQTPAS